MAKMNEMNNPYPGRAPQQPVRQEPQAVLTQPTPQQPAAPPKPPEPPAAPAPPAVEELPGDDPTKPIEMMSWVTNRVPSGMASDQFHVGCAAPRSGGRAGATGMVQSITMLPNGMVRIRFDVGIIIVSGGYGLTMDKVLLKQVLHQ